METIRIDGLIETLEERLNIDRPAISSFLAEVRRSLVDMNEQWRDGTSTIRNEGEDFMNVMRAVEVAEKIKQTDNDTIRILLQIGREKLLEKEQRIDALNIELLEKEEQLRREIGGRYE